MAKLQNTIKKSLIGLLVLGLGFSSACNRGTPFDPNLGGEVYTMGLIVVPNSNRVDVLDMSVNRVTQSLQTDDRPSSIAVSPDGRMILVTNENSGTVSVYLRRDNDNFVKSNSVGNGQHPIGVAFNPRYSEAYVAYADDGKVLILDTRDRNASPKVVNAINLASASPKEIVVSADGNKVFITDGLNDRVVTLVRSGSNFNFNTNYSQPFDQANPASVDFGGMIVVDNSQPAQPGQPVVPPTQTRLFIANSARSNVFVFDGNTGQIINSIELQDNQFVGQRQVGPRNLVLYRNPLNGQQKVYVTGYNASVVSVIDAQSMRLLKNIPLASNTPDRGSFNPVGIALGNNASQEDIIYVTNSSGLNLSIIDPITDTLKRNIGTTNSLASQPPLGEMVGVGAAR